MRMLNLTNLVRKVSRPIRRPNTEDNGVLPRIGWLGLQISGLITGHLVQVFHTGLICSISRTTLIDTFSLSSPYSSVSAHTSASILSGDLREDLGT